MRTKITLFLVAAALLIVPAQAQETPAAIAKAYGALADSILALRGAEASLVTAILDDHYQTAKRMADRANWEGAAAHMALFANEGDNTIAGIRKRLLEGGHHFNAAGEEQGIFEEGYVVVNRKAKKKMLEAVSTLRQATGEDARKAAWAAFDEVAKKLLGMG